MNKRFFTLMAAVMLAGSPFAATEAFAEDYTQTVMTGDNEVYLANGLKFVVKSSTGTDQYYTVSTPSNGTVTIGAAAAYNNETTAVFEIRNYSSSTKTFELYVGSAKVVSGDNSVFYADKSGVVGTTDFTAIKTAVVGTAGNPIMAGTAAFVTTKMDVNDLNSNLSNNGFKFNFPGLAIQPEDNPFAEQMIAIQASTIDGSAADPYKMFFVKADEAGLKLKAQVNADNIKAATFIVVNPNKNFGITSLYAIAGEGYDFTTIKGEKLAADNKAADGVIAYTNGVFQVEETDCLNAGDELDIKAALKYSNGVNENGANADVHVGVYSLTAGGLKSYVTTAQDESLLSKATTGGNTYAAAADVLKTAKEAAIYNIFFQGSTKEQGTSTSSYGKYYVAGNVASAPKNVNTKLAKAQWVVTDVQAKGYVTLENVYNRAESITLKLYKTSTAGVYQVADGFSGIPAYGTEYIKLIPATEGSNFMALTDSQLARKATIVFNGSGAVSVSKVYPQVKDDAAAGATTPDYKIYATSDADNAAAWSLKKSDKVTHEMPFAYLKGNSVANDKAKCEIQTYNLVWADKAYGVANNGITGTLSEYSATSAPNFVKCAFLVNANGTYTVIEANANTVADAGGNVLNYDDILQGKVLSVNTANTIASATPQLQFAVANTSSYETVSVSVEELGESLPAISRHATFEGIEGGISAAADAKGMIHAIVSSEPLTFWLDTAESKAETPKFYISFGIADDEEEEVETKAAEEAEVRMFLYTPTDSIWTWDANKAEKVENKNYYNAVKDLRAIYRPAALVGVDTIATLQGAKEVLVSKEAKSGVCVGGLDRFQFAITKLGEDYVITNHADKYLYNLNGVLGFTEDKDKAMLVTLGEGDPTANAAIETASSIEVIGGQGVVTVQGAAGKVITVANILGQTIANQVAASDNVTIAAPAGIVVVSVDGEATKVIVK